MSSIAIGFALARGTREGRATLAASLYPKRIFSNSVSPVSDPSSDLRDRPHLVIAVWTGNASCYPVSSRHHCCPHLQLPLMHAAFILDCQQSVWLNLPRQSQLQLQPNTMEMTPKCAGRNSRDDANCAELISRLDLRYIYVWAAGISIRDVIAWH